MPTGSEPILLPKFATFKMRGLGMKIQIKIELLNISSSNHAEDIMEDSDQNTKNAKMICPLS